MKKTFVFSLLALTAFFVFAQSAPVEARHHCHGCRSRTNFNVSVGSGYAYRDAYVVRRVVQPVAPVYVADYYAPAYAAPVYVTPAPYVEDVYVAPAYRPAFGGLSFSWNFFK